MTFPRPTNFQAGDPDHASEHNRVNEHLNLLNQADVERDARWLRGTGFPTMAAPVGTRYTDTAATNGAIEWIKATGTGNTGWRVTDGDTGWRNIAGLMDAGWTASGASAYLRIRRVGSEVFLNGRIARVEAGGLLYGLTTLLSSVPAGFITATPYTPAGVATTTSLGIMGALGAFSTSTVINLAYFQNTTLQYTAGQIVSFTSRWSTVQPWPTTLPGTPA